MVQQLRWRRKTYAIGGVANVTQSGYQIDGSSIRFDLIDNPSNPCSANCYGNVFFWNVLTHNVSETSVTDDFYAMMDSVGNSNSQAVEFTVEHDLCKLNCGQSNEEDFLYIYSVQCDFKDTKNGACGTVLPTEAPAHGSLHNTTVCRTRRNPLTTSYSTSFAATSKLRMSTCGSTAYSIRSTMSPTELNRPHQTAIRSS